MQRRSLLLLLLPLSVQAQTAPRELTVSAAASLADAFKALAPGFEAAHPGARLRFNFAGSGQLLQQIAQGAPVDVFASADEATMDRAAAQQLIDPTSRHPFARNELVLVTPPGSALASLSGLQHAAVKRIAVGKPATVPVGRYTQQALERAQLWQALQPKLVPADHVRQVLDYVARGEVEAGFVYRSDVRGARVRLALQVEGHEPVRYPVAAVAGSRHPQLARAFIDHLLGASAQALLRAHGFLAP
ncbi:molybdate ABC transporter substrate-binding protein [Inhella proteolytica]|uniref:Molybdate ABC transporter substrate-binding protein n=1 Tax=Inhella proteolytica TaxID=2795029 RepID=A0A931JBA2_9BURK|nr:molybdate ABC transporter substrate-binding protein [Inhella proteolytica]MBH9579450.1 molybdate ABC transporter substrate-binding protein [Inhella proteolytica]